MQFRQQIAQTIRRIPLLMRAAYYVYRFFQPKFSIGVVGVVINDQQEVLLVEHVFHPKRPWGLPGGWIGFDEDPATTAQREISEELGLDVSIKQLLVAEKTQYHHIDFAYLCHSSSTDIAKLSYELLGYDWFTRQTLPPIHAFHYLAIEAAFDVLKMKE
ncbi:MAG: NUDIX hydrolase [Phototrophicaceae bacterium]